MGWREEEESVTKAEADKGGETPASMERESLLEGSVHLSIKPSLDIKQNN